MNLLLRYYQQVLVLLCCSIMLHACKTDYMAYDVDRKDGIYFYTDSLIFQFGMLKGEDFDVSIPVQVLGTPKNYDREFNIILVKEETTAKPGVHYDIPQSFTIKANAVAGSVPLILHRYSDPQLAKDTFVIKMQLMENDHFKLVMKDTCRLKFSDTELPRPRWWSERHFGPYSQMLMMDILNNYWDLENTRPLLFERIVGEYGRNLERALSFPSQQEIAFIKYIITPAYLYYLEHPHPNVVLPDPATLL